MGWLIEGAFRRQGAAILALLFLLVGGAYAYVVIPKEAAPEIEIPIFTVDIVYPGVSAEDSARLLVRPMERQLQGIAGLRTMTARAGEGFASIRLEFAAGGDQSRALIDVRDRVELARADLPAGAEEPTVTEFDISLFPVVTATLSGNVAERALLAIAREVRDELEGLPGVLEVDLAGDREDLMEVLVDPVAIESYRVSFQEVADAVDRNNRLIAAGALATGAGRIPVQIPGTVEGIDDVLGMAVLVRNGTVVRLGDIAEVRQTFRDPESFARVDGAPTVALEIRKTAGANIIETVAAAQALIEQARQEWPEAIQVDYLQNQADDVEDLLGDLENNVIAAVILVMLVVVLALGVRASILVAVAIPGAFLSGILGVYALGFTLNIVVLFALILVVGMLVDGAIVVVDLAQRNRAEGTERREAFRRAALRMAWPVTASIATTLAVFVPLLFWPGVAGEFMRFLPATVIVTLAASLLMALVFIPVLGGLFGRAEGGSALAAPEGRVIGAYRRALGRAVAAPGLVLVAVFGIAVAVWLAWGTWGRGMDFFPDVEPQFVQVQIQSQGTYSIWEADALVRQVEAELIGAEGVRVAYARTIGSTEARTAANLTEDVIGTVQLDLEDWRARERARVIIDRLRAQIEGVPGLAITVREQDRGPGEGLPVEIEVAGPTQARILETIDAIRAMMVELGGFTDVTDDRPLAGVELRIAVDRAEAARYGADVALLGGAVQLLTDGMLIGTYRPDFADDEVEIRLRFPADERSLGQLASLRVLTEAGPVPISNFATLQPAPLTGLVTRVDGRRVHTLEADVAEGAIAGERLAALEQRIAAADLGDDVEVTFRGQAEDQAEAGSFLILAFATALFLMLLILVLQFNSFYQAGLVLSAIVFSTAGVLIGLMIRGEAFSIVMSGMGVIALGGIVVNNNIVLIDAYNELRARGLAAAEAAVEAGAQRLRPVLLTAVTTAVGLAPMALGLTIDFTGRDIHVGAPSTQFWVQLATSIIGGLLMATLVTVGLTPALLAWRGTQEDRAAGR